MNISAPFIKHPIATTLIMAAVFLVGLVAYPMLPVAPLPQIDFPTIQVSAALPGASPQTMASSVAAPLERQFAQIAGVTEMTSTSTLGSTSITVQFDLNRDIDGAAQDIQSAISAASGQLPRNLPNVPSFRKVNPADSPILVLAVHSDAFPITQVDDFADNVISQQISQIPGVGLVTIGGQQKPAVRVQIDPAKLAALGLGMEDVATVITNATVDAPKGSVNGTLRNFTIYDNDQLTNAAPWNDVIVAYSNGGPVRIRDIGKAVDGPEDRTLSAWQNGKPGILLIIYKQPGANVVDTVARIRAALPSIMTAVPPAIKIDNILDRTTTIRASVSDVEFTLAITFGLVVMVIFVFLRNASATIIPSVTVPLALLGTAGMMYLIGYSIDNLSLMGLTIAVGFVVDDAIVMLENIQRHIEGGMKPFEAALKGAGEIGFTIVSISVSLVAVFIPLLLMGGIVGRLFREFAVVVTMTIAISAIVALTLTPMMSSRFLQAEGEARHGRLYKLTERAFDKLLAGYTYGLDFALAHRRLVLGVFAAVLASTILLFVEIPKGFFPQQDTGVIVGFSQAAQDVSSIEMARLQHRLTDVIARDPDVASWAASVGGSRSINTGQIFIALKPSNQRTATADQIIRRLQPQLARVQGAALFLQAAQDLNVGGRLSRTQYQYTLQDASLDELNQWAPRLLARLSKVPSLTDVATDQQTSGTMLSLVIDRDQAARFGIEPALIDQTLYDAFGQRQVTQYFTQLNSYHVVLEVDPALQGATDTLDKLYVKSPITGQQVPISTFAKYDTNGVTYLSINHQGQFPAVTLSFNLAPGAALGQAVADIQAAATQIGMPASIAGTFQGTAQAFQSSLSSTPFLILAALVAVYIILGVLYESFIHPLTILSTLPSAGVGALLMLMMFHFDLSVIAIIGIILLIGIVKKNGIMMVDFAIHAEREEGLSPEQSIRQACLLRFRPIMMTTMAAMLGALPLMLGHGTGSELRQPLGYAMVGGLALSQALTLFTTPVIYLYLDRVNVWLGQGHVLKRLLALGLSGALLGGCVDAPSTTPRETTLKAKTLGLGSAPAPAVGDTWWTAFNDPQLNALVENSQKGSPTLAAAMARVRQAQAELASSRAATYPQLTLDAGETRERFSKDDIIPPPYGGTTQWVGTVQANLSWSLDLFGRQAAEIARARSSAKAAQLDATAARLMLAGSVTQAYISLRRAYALIDVAQETVRQRQGILALTSGRVRAGLDNRASQKQAEALLAVAREDLIGSEADRDLAVHQIAALIGRGADAYDIARPHLNDNALALPQSLPADLLARRADIAAAEARIDAAVQGREVARTAFYPDINLIGLAGWAAIGLAPMFSGSALQYGAGPAIHLPMFDAGKLRADYAGATTELDAAVADYNAAVVGAVKQTADAMTELKSLQAESGEQQLSLGAADASFALATERYRSGLNPQTNALDAESLLIQARERGAALTSDIASARVSLLMAIGGGFTSAKPAIAPNQEAANE